MGVLPWILGAVVVLSLAVVAGLGTAYLVSVFRAAPPPRTALPPATPTAPLTRTPVPTADVSAAPSSAATDEPEPSEEPVATAGPDGTPLVHVVQRGESISLIAQEYGVTIEAIIELNELANPNVIVPGQELLIPAPPP